MERRLLAEAKRALIERKPLTAAVADRWVGYLRQSFPDGRVEIIARPPGVDLSAMTADPDDEHVCALAVAGRADLLIAFDRGYLSEPLTPTACMSSNPTNSWRSPSRSSRGRFSESSTSRPRAGVEGGRSHSYWMRWNARVPDASWLWCEPPADRYEHTFGVQFGVQFESNPEELRRTRTQRTRASSTERHPNSRAGGRAVAGSNPVSPIREKPCKSASY